MENSQTTIVEISLRCLFKPMKNVRAVSENGNRKIFKFKNHQNCRLRKKKREIQKNAFKSKKLQEFFHYSKHQTESVIYFCS